MQERGRHYYSTTHLVRVWEAGGKDGDEGPKKKCMNIIKSKELLAQLPLFVPFLLELLHLPGSSLNTYPPNTYLPSLIGCPPMLMRTMMRRRRTFPFGCAVERPRSKQRFASVNLLMELSACGNWES